MTAAGTASETAAAKIRRVLPERLARRLDAVLGSLAFTAPPGESAAPETAVLLCDRRRGAPSPAGLDQVHRRRRPAQRTHPAPVRAGRPLGPVVRHGRGSRDRRGPDLPARPHRGRAGPCPARSSRPPGSTRPSACCPGSPRLRTGIEVTLRIQGDGRADPGPASGQRREHRGSAAAGADPQAERWLRVELRAERLDWLPAVLASLDRPFVIERPGRTPRPRRRARRAARRLGPRGRPVGHAASAGGGSAGVISG